MGYINNNNNNYNNNNNNYNKKGGYQSVRHISESPQYGSQVMDHRMGHDPRNNISGILSYQEQSGRSGASTGSGSGSGNSYPRESRQSHNMGPSSTGGSNAQGCAINKVLLEILRERVVDPQRLGIAVDANIERMDCVNLATLLFHTGKKRLLLAPSVILRIAHRFSELKEELRAREASNALYGLKCMSSECIEVRQLIYALANKVTMSSTELVAQAVGNALYGCQLMTSDHEEVRFLLEVLAIKVSRCTELLEAQNVGNALYGLRGMSSDCKEVRSMLAALTPQVATACEDLNGQALGNSLYGLQCMSSKEPEVRQLIVVMAAKILRIWEELKAQEVGNALYGLKRMNSDVPEVCMLLDALVPKVHSSPDILDAQAIGNSFYGMQSMKCDKPAVAYLMSTMADKVTLSIAEMDGQAIGNSLYGLQGMRSEYPEVQKVIAALTTKIQTSRMNMNAQELGNALHGMQNFSTDQVEVRRLLSALAQKAASSNYEFANPDISNALFGLQRMSSEAPELRVLLRHIAHKTQKSQALMDPPAIASALFGLQRMSSEAEEVRSIVFALAGKIEQSWKLLSGLNISYALFSMQKLSAADAEVRKLLHVLEPKIVAFRDEMTAVQLCVSLYGMQSLSSEFEEVKNIAATMAEKVKFCTESLLTDYFSAAMFGLQGLSSGEEDVAALVQAIVGNLADKPQPATFSIDLDAFSNAIFGLQRMSTSTLPVVELLHHLGVMFNNLCVADTLMSMGACGNIIYGLQGCSCTNENVLGMMQAALRNIDTILNTPRVASSHEILSTSDLLSVHHSLCFAGMCVPDIESQEQLQKDFARLVVLTTQIIDERTAASNLQLKNVTLFEARLCNSLTDVLVSEPFAVTCGELLHGFETAAIVKLHPGLTLLKADGTKWNPVLNVEVEGTSSRHPAKQQFDRLRNSYLSKYHGIVVESVPADAFNMAPGFHRNILRIRPGLLKGLHPPQEEKEDIDSKLRASGSWAAGLLSTVNDESTLLTLHLQQPRMGMFSASESEMYIDDNLECNVQSINSTVNFAPRGLKNNYGMHAGWRGARPVIVGQSSNINHIPRVLQKGGMRSGSRNLSPKDGIISPIISTAPSARHSPLQMTHGDPNRPPIPGQMISHRDISMDGDNSVASAASANSYHGIASVTTYETKSSATSSLSSNAPTREARETDADVEIALLERQLEIARIEAKLLELKSAKLKKAANNH